MNTYKARSWTVKVMISVFWGVNAILAFMRALGYYMLHPIVEFWCLSSKVRLVRQLCCSTRAKQSPDFWKGVGFHETFWPSSRFRLRIQFDSLLLKEFRWSSIPYALPTEVLAYLNLQIPRLLVSATGEWLRSAVTVYRFGNVGPTPEVRICFWAT